MKKIWLFIAAGAGTGILVLGWYWGVVQGLPPFLKSPNMRSPFISQNKVEQLPLIKYSFENLPSFPYQSSQLTIEKQIASQPEYASYVFSFQTLGKTMTGQLNLPSTPAPAHGYPVIVMLRGWAPEETYTVGTGTKAAATVFAHYGYVTLAPDFFGYGGSDPEADNPWEARLQKPINVMELLKTIQENPEFTIEGQRVNLNACSCQHAIWAHSNGGQIALSVLEILEQPLPTTLWAPVTAPFPYSMLFYSDEHEDEGKEMRAWLAQFEEDYDVFEFSLTQHLHRLTGSIQVHQGTADDAVPVAWNDEFVEKVETENKHRKEIIDQIKASTSSAEVKLPLPQVELTYYKYPGADHNLKPAWNTVVQRDVQFFNQQLD